MDFDDPKDTQYPPQISIKSALLGTLPTDPPLLKELGIDFTTIKKESNLIFKINGNINYDFIKNADITGPIIFILLYSFFLLINCKIHFGYVYIISLFSIFMTYFLLNVVCNEINVLEVCSVMGYSFIPVMMFSLIGVLLSFFNVNFVVKVGLGLISGGWAAYTGSKTFIMYLGVRGKVFVVGYPLFICYLCYSMIVIF